MTSINFFLRTNNKKDYYIFCRVNLKNTTSEFSLTQKVQKEYWCKKTNTYKSDNQAENEYIETLVSSVHYKLKTLAVLQEFPTAKDLIDEFLGRNDKTVLLRDIIQNYIDNCKAKTGTIKAHKIKLNNFLEFEKLMKTNYTPETFKLSTCKQFVNWFMSSRGTVNKTSANRNVGLLKIALNWYNLNNKFIDSELLHFKVEKDKVTPPVFLTKTELTALQTTLFKSELLTKIKDLFLFQCYTGISYIDLWSDWEIVERDYGFLICGTRLKNGQRFFIPIENTIVLTILEKYQGKLPKVENQVYNRLLKEIAALVGIDKRITTHTGRKTFATLMDGNGWTRETIAKMLGHTSYKTTEQYYLGDSLLRVENEFKSRC